MVAMWNKEIFVFARVGSCMPRPINLVMLPKFFRPINISRDKFSIKQGDLIALIRFEK